MGGLNDKTNTKNILLLLTPRFVEVQTWREPRAEEKHLGALGT